MITLIPQYNYGLIEAIFIALLFTIFPNGGISSLMDWSMSQVRSPIRNVDLFEDLIRNLWLEGKGNRFQYWGGITQSKGVTPIINLL